MGALCMVEWQVSRDSPGLEVKAITYRDVLRFAMAPQVLRVARTVS